MQKSIFDFSNYKTYLLHEASNQPNGGYGFRAQLATAADCQRAFVSQVLQKEAHFNLEQAERINTFLKHDADEARYFIFLILYARAGTKNLKEHFYREMKNIVLHRLTLKNRFKSERELNLEQRTTYYSSWEYGAIRVAVSIPGIDTPTALSKKLKIPLKRVQEV